MNDQSGFASLERILISKYGVTLAHAPVAAIEWAALELADRSWMVARGQLTAANKERERLGKIGFYPPYGHRLFPRGAL